MGREIDTKLVKEFKEMGNINLCGEKGEFHTFVYDGPISKNPVKFITGDKELKDTHCFLELLPQKKEVIRNF